MRNIILIVAISLLALVGCKQGVKENASESKAEQSAQTVESFSKDDVANWEGTYFGVLPCASCPGINTLITLFPDGRFEKVIEYKGKKDGVSTTKGTIVWEANNTQLLLGEELYEVDGDLLLCLDKNGKKVEGELAEDYILQRTELETSPDINDGYNLVIFLGSDNKIYNIVFNTNTETPIASVNAENFQKTLIQTEAWAKGAIYKGNNVELSMKGNKGELIIDGKKITLKEK